ncbi:hypothetical protein HYV85_02755 [Candidatus Woesearchaeota archaeon]|nr:hypothetical protein [Candidatus Woesearchaeota archaeon]
MAANLSKREGGANVPKENWVTILQRLQREAEAELKQEKEGKPKNKEEETIVAAPRSKETDADNLKLLVTVLKDLANAIHSNEHKQESLTPVDKRKRILQKLQQRINEAFSDAEKELDSIN